MTVHFLRGELSPYYWGERYYGVLDQLLLMPLFMTLGSDLWVSRLVPFSLTLLFVVGMHRLLLATEPRWPAHVAGLLLAVPAPLEMEITFSTYNYAFLAALGVLCLIVVRRLLLTPTQGRSFAVGVLAGVSLYYFRLILVFWVAIGVWYGLTRLTEERRQALARAAQALDPAFIWHKIVLLERVALAPGIKAVLVAVNLANAVNLVAAILLWFHGDLRTRVGDVQIGVPFWPTLKVSLVVGSCVYIVVHKAALWMRLRGLLARPAGRAVVAGFAIGYLPAVVGSMCGEAPWSPGGVVSLPVLWANIVLLARSLLAGSLVGDGGQIVLVLISRVLTAGAVTLLFARFWHDLRTAPSASTTPASLFGVLAGIGLLMGVGCVRFADAQAIRYLLPFLACIPVGLAWLLERVHGRSRLLAHGLLSVLIANNLLAHYRFWSSRSSEPPQAALARRLVERGIRGGYADYWVAFYVTRLAGESVVLAPISGVDRYPPYGQIVRSLERIACVGPPPEGRRMRIRDEEYRVMAHETCAGFEVTYMKKRPVGRGGRDRDRRRDSRADGVAFNEAP